MYHHAQKEVGKTDIRIENGCVLRATANWKSGTFNYSYLYTNVLHKFELLLCMMMFVDMYRENGQRVFLQGLGQ